MLKGADWKRCAAKAAGILTLAGAALVFAHSTKADNYRVSAACGHNYVPNVIKIDGDVNVPVALTVSQIAALPGQQTLNIAYLNHLGVAQTHSETGPTLWTVLSIAAGGIKVPPPTRNEYVGEPAAQTTLYIMVVGTDGYETLISEAEIDPGFGNAPILLAYAEDGVPLSKVPYNATEFKGPAQLVVPTDTHGGRYANQICRIKVANGAL
ncbi:MAG TPA: hypothetical protein VKT99_20085 [Xanthobacteraceae bacterium]|jgi:DMSO/TMAO reductase YedYZ molybdopterin-dependent catalytic subunit|nr:hypothetical protein [Xanthobacteraceae bacterium]